MKTLVTSKVIITPTKGDWLTRYSAEHKKSEEYYSNLDAEELIKQIKRHCEPVKDIEIERFYECSFCGQPWEEMYDSESKMILPACCSDAEKEARIVVDGSRKQ